MALVVVAGVPRAGDPEFGPLFDYCGIATETIQVGSRDKLVAAPLGSVARRAVALFPECGRFLD